MSNKNIHPDPPFVELGFYFADRSDADAFADLFKALINLGLTYQGIAWIKQQKNVRSQTFKFWQDLQPLKLEISLEKLHKSLSNPDIRMFQIAMNDRGKPILVTYNMVISETKSKKDYHPIVVLGEGELFCGPDSVKEQSKQPTQQEGQKTYERFLEIIEMLQPAYGSITVEYSLECPTDLREDDRSLAFRDFFISEEYIGGANIAIIQDIFADAYQAKVKGGLYVSCSWCLNPQRKDLESNIAYKGSRTVAQLIATV